MRATTRDIEATLTRAHSSSSLPWPVLAVLAWRSLVQARYVLLASLFLLAAFQMILVGQASALEEAHSFGRMAEFVPAFLQRGLGSQSMLLVSFKGTVALGYFHPVVAILVSVLALTLFLGGWSAPVSFALLGMDTPGWIAKTAWFWDWFWLFFKTFLLVTVFLWIRASFPRYRYDQIMRLGWKVFIPITIAWICVTALLAYYNVFTPGQ